MLRRSVGGGARDTCFMAEGSHARTPLARFGSSLTTFRPRRGWSACPRVSARSVPSSSGSLRGTARRLEDIGVGRRCLAPDRAPARAFDFASATTSVAILAQARRPPLASLRPVSLRRRRLVRWSNSRWRSCSARSTDKQPDKLPQRWVRPLSGWLAMTRAGEDWQEYWVRSTHYVEEVAA